MISSHTTNNNSKKYISLLSMGDWGAHEPYTYYQKVVAKRMNHVASIYDIQAVLCAGDNFYEVGVTGLPPGIMNISLESQIRENNTKSNNIYEKLKNIYELSKKWVPDEQWERAYQNVYRHPNMTHLKRLPFIVALGNHDYYGVPDAQIAFSYLDPTRLWRMPSNYYTYTINKQGKSILIVVIDTVLLCKHGEKRRQHKHWIVDMLKKGQCHDCIVVMGHYPIHSNGGHCGDNLNAQNTNALNTNISNNVSNNVRHINAISKNRTIKRWLIETLLKYNVDLYINGHNHNLEYCAIKDDKHERVLHCITTGSASKMYNPRSNHKCSFSLSSLYSIIKPNSVTNESMNSFEAPIFGYGFVQHELCDHHFVHTFHYISPKDAKESNHENKWKVAIIKTQLLAKSNKLRN